MRHIANTYLHALSRIPRDEVEETSRIVMRELDTILTGCTSTIVGGWASSFTIYYFPPSSDSDLIADTDVGSLKVMMLTW